MEVDVGTVKHWLDAGATDAGQPIFLLDCREPNEWDAARIDGATLAPMTQWPPAPDIWDAMQGKQVVVHCHHGVRSLRVTDWLRKNGFADAMSMAGGIDAWSLQIDPSVPRY